MTKNNNRGIYIQSVEAARIWEHTNRDTKLHKDYNGSVPYSLEVIKLRKEGMNEFVKRWTVVEDENGNVVKNEEGKDKKVIIDKSIKELDARTLKSINKFYTDDIINVKFGSKVDTIDGVVKKVNDKYDKRVKNENAKRDKELESTGVNEKQIEAINNTYDKKIKQLRNDADNRIEELQNAASLNVKMWELTLPITTLREEMYQYGFTLKDYNGVDVNYVVYKRSSAKAREGNCLFIRKELADVMVNWSRMGLTIPSDYELDLAALAAYEALVTSTIKDTIKIHPKNILLIDDVESVFKQGANVIEKVTVKNGQEILRSQFEEDQEVTNSLWDGMGLLDVSYFTGDIKGRGMIQARQHFFKSVLFNTNIQQFMEDTYGKEDYQTAKVKDVLGNEMLVKNVRCIVTPSSLKVFKFSHLVGGDNQMYKHWQDLVKSKEEGCLFGVCKSESKSKLGELDGMPLQQLSYQMCNSLALDASKAEELSEFEVNYINDVKNDNDKFVTHLEANVTLSNSNQMMADLYRHNPNIAKTEFFNVFKTNEINQYMHHIKKGKLRVIGDYNTLCGNPYEMLLHSINQLDLHNLKSHTLHKNEVYTKLFNDGDKLAGFRNPHTSNNNILYCENKKIDEIDTYFNFTKNIVVVNAIGFAIQDILSGCDYDGDAMLLTNNEIIVKIAEENKAKICLNKVSAEPNTYELNNLNRSKVDKAIASDVIGRIVNVGQAAQSVMCDAIHNDNKELADEMKEILEVISVGSTIAIDLAKKKYSIEIDKELIRLEDIVKSKLKTKEVKEDGETIKQKSFPMFMSKKSKRTYYNTSMDYIYAIFTVSDKQIKDELGIKFDTKVKRADELKSSEMIKMWDLVKKCDDNGEIFEIKKANDKQEREIITSVNEYSLAIKAYQAQRSGASDSEKERIGKEILKESEALQTKMSKMKIKPVTIHSILYHAFNKETIDKNVIKVLNAVYLSCPDKFIKLFLQEK